ncbi:MAG: hypothetical protein KGZ58_12780 [Ignavibacteriales bacterium]|nr:hypothetical protein [Ignavibacteriales bacterium]
MKSGWPIFQKMCWEICKRRFPNSLIIHDVISTTVTEYYGRFPSIPVELNDEILSFMEKASSDKKNDFQPDIGIYEIEDVVKLWNGKNIPYTNAMLNKDILKEIMSRRRQWWVFDETAPSRWEKDLKKKGYSIKIKKGARPIIIDTKSHEKNIRWGEIEKLQADAYMCGAKKCYIIKKCSAKIQGDFELETCKIRVPAKYRSNFKNYIDFVQIKSYVPPKIISRKVFWEKYGEYFKKYDVEYYK